MMYEARKHHAIKCLWLIFGFVCVIWSLGCSTDVPCTSDANCTKSGERCVNGVCAVGAAGSDCTYEGKTYQDGDTFKAKDGCNDCTCKSGSVSCTERGCVKTCDYEGKTYQEGDTFKDKDGCNDCTCKAGVAECTQRACPPTAEGCTGTCTKSSDYCDYAADAACGETGAKGTCKAKPQDCPSVEKPVCGCDNKTYSNECKAHAAGVSVMRDGACQSGPERCGGSVACSDRTKQYCHYDITDACGETNAQGTCKDKPQGCDDLDKPVCGCDSKTYSNECEAHSAGVSVQKEGPCQSTEPRCGGSVVCPDLQGQFCDFDASQSCGDKGDPGYCKARPTSCPDANVPVCGCDGKTYNNKCLANKVGVAVRAEGACGTGGGGCDRKNPCTNPDEYCHYEEKEACGGSQVKGSCKKKSTGCPKIKQIVCGCDGKTYDNACFANAAGTSVSQQGACCQANPKTCGGFFNVPCQNPGDFCKLEIRDLCGAADAPGVCTPKPGTCTTQSDPVCGCDGKDYKNECDAHAAGVSVSFKGSCTQPPGSCVYKGTSYDDGKSFSFRCNTCTCTKGVVTCTQKTCPAESCGSEGAAPCPAGFYCDRATHCGLKGAAGTCKEIRSAPCLISDPSPVCGCDNRTYRSACDAERAGISVKAPDACQCQAP